MTVLSYKRQFFFSGHGVNVKNIIKMQTFCLSSGRLIKKKWHACFDKKKKYSILMFVSNCTPTETQIAFLGVVILMTQM